MGGFTKMMKLIFNKRGFQKIGAYALLLLFIYIFKDFLGIFLLTFIFAYLFFGIAKFIKEKSCKLSKRFLFFKFMEKLPIWVIVLIEYLIFIWLIVYIFSNIIPTVKSEINSITNEFSIIKNVENDKWLTFIEWEESLSEKSGSVQIITAINNFKESILQKLVLIDPEDNLKMTEYVENFGSNIDLKSFQKKTLNILSSIWSSTLKIILALILSFIFIVDRKRLFLYLSKIKESNFWFLHTEYKILLEKVVKSFWLILKAQSLIALANTILTIIWLLIIGFIFGTPENPTFPYILTLALIVFVMGFVPVLWVVLSSIPIMIIWYITYWDFMVIPIIVLLIVIVHIVEAYYLNPRIVSSFLKIPVSLTFIILLVSEHFFWLAWLLVWISLFYFLMWLIKDFDKMIWKNKKKIEKNKKSKKPLQKEKKN